MLSGTVATDSRAIVKSFALGFLFLLPLRSSFLFLVLLSCLRYSANQQQHTTHSPSLSVSNGHDDRTGTPPVTHNIRTFAR
uniref:Putative secreted peptide n=1 Tax=Anopheles braziliensis TaxID=58242 RepID=A0A2M3ZXH7_9DIPT